MISPLAYVDKEARIGANVTIHPFAYIDKNVEIGDNCTIMPYASILSGTRMGTDNIIYQGAIIGATPQDFKFKGEDTLLKIGNHNTIREKVILNRGTNTTDCTIIGDGNFLLEGVHSGTRHPFRQPLCIGKRCQNSRKLYYRRQGDFR